MFFLQGVFFIMFSSRLSFPVQLRGQDPRTQGNDCQTAGAGDGLQDNGQRERLDEGQKEGVYRADFQHRIKSLKLILLFLRLMLSRTGLT